VRPADRSRARGVPFPGLALRRLIVGDAFDWIERSDQYSCGRAVSLGDGINERMDAVVEIDVRESGGP